MPAKKYTGEPDIIVVGGGPAGIMAAGRAAELGCKVLLIEKTYRLGSKLLMTGGGRCNVTNTAGSREFIDAFGKNGRFLYRALSTFSNTDLQDFFAARGVPLRADPDGKVFPADDKAESVLAALRRYLDTDRVRLLHNIPVTRIVYAPDAQLTAGGVQVASGILKAKSVIIATGGASYPRTGSTGDGYALAHQCGHALVPPRPGLTALVSNERFIKQLQGLTLTDVVMTVLVDGKPLTAGQGNLLFTHFGVSGPMVLVLSNAIVDALAPGRKVELSVPLVPFTTLPAFERHLQQQLESRGPSPLFRYLEDILPGSLAPVVEERCRLKPGLKCSMVNREERTRIARQLTDFRVSITTPRPIEEATITRGGVALDGIDPLTMRSRLVNGLYFCGEVLDVDGITGGYNLQAAFSTGYLAGSAAAHGARA